MSAKNEELKSSDEEGDKLNAKVKSSTRQERTAKREERRKREERMSGKDGLRFRTASCTSKWLFFFNVASVREEKGFPRDACTFHQGPFVSHFLCAFFLSLHSCKHGRRRSGKARCQPRQWHVQGLFCW